MVGQVAQALGQHHGVLGGQGGALARGGRRGVGGVADDHHRAAVPGRDRRQVVGAVAGELEEAVADQVAGRAGVAGEQLDQLALPLLGGGGRPLGRGDRGAGDVGEPDRAAGGVGHVAEEGPPAEDHVPGARLGRPGAARGVAAEVDQADVAGAGGGRVDQAPGRRVDPVGPDQQVAAGLGAVVEGGDHAAGGGLGPDQPLAVLDPDAAAGRLLVEGLVQPGPLDGVADRPVGQPPAVADGPQPPAGPAQEDVGRGREAGGQHRLVGADGAQGVEAVGGHGQVGAGVAGSGEVGLVDLGVDAGVLQRHGGDRAGDAAPGDQCLDHLVLLSSRKVFRLDELNIGYTGRHDKPPCSGRRARPGWPAGRAAGAASPWPAGPPAWPRSCSTPPWPPGRGSTPPRRRPLTCWNAPGR